MPQNERNEEGEKTGQSEREKLVKEHGKGSKEKRLEKT